MTRTIARVITVAALFLATASAWPSLAAQSGTLTFIGAEIPLAPVIKGAPFSADATTQMTQMLADGTRIDQTTRGKLFRDSEGRVRREQTIRGLNALDPSIDGQTIVTIVDPVAGVRYVLDPRKKEARRVATGAAFERQQAQAGLRREARGLPPPPPPPPPPGGEPALGPRAGSMPPPPSPPPPPLVGESLGTRQIEGLTANGIRNTSRIETGQVGNDRPIEVTDERWQSVNLKVLLLSRHHDPRLGDVEYRLTNIVRGEPGQELFAVPADYRVLDAQPDRP
jgi:hypothetical protein